MRSAGPDTDRGEAMRYLAELPWAPYAIRANPGLDWAGISSREAEVSTTVAGRRVSVRLSLDGDGLIRSASAMRPRLDAGSTVDRPWVGEYGEYVELGGVLVPGTAEVRWDLPEGPFTYWRGSVTSLEAE
jgi:hypothetical protein